MHETRQELSVGTPEGATKSREFMHEGSEEEKWTLEKASDMKGVPLHRDPTAVGVEVTSRVIL